MVLIEAFSGERPPPMRRFIPTVATFASDRESFMGKPRTCSVRLKVLLDEGPKRDHHSRGRFIDANLRRGRISHSKVEAKMRLAGIALVTKVAETMMET